MSLLLVGCLLVMLGGLLISFPELCLSLKKHDEGMWQQLGNPHGHMFTSKTIAVFSWVLARGYTLVDSDEVFDLGEQAYRQALTAKYLFIIGVILLVVGFFVSLMYVGI
ncbi:hypothetical protein TDB9533_02922 [Thalassocella blandensis]|nr:hypothetical protein TDB9533_02922 [Thalassocella blandensis]